MAKNERQPTVLITRFSALGDVAMSIPVVYDVCRSYPDVRFVMATKAGIAAMFVNPPSNLTVAAIDLKQEFGGTTGVVRLFKYLRREYRYDMLVDLHDVTRTKVLRLLSRMAGVRVSSIDKRRSERRRLTRRRPGEELRELESSFERYGAAFRALGFEPQGRFTTLFDGARPSEAEAAAIVEGIAEPKRPGERWIAVAPFAAHRGKIYPEELMAEVVRRLSAQPEVRLFMFGAGAEERAAIERMTAGLPRVVSMAEQRVGFARELQLLRLMDAALTMDSGNMHLSSLTGIAVVSVWGQTHPACGFYGWRQDRANALGAEMECRPCSVFGNRACRFGDYRCLRAVTPEQIVNRINLTIKSK